MTLTRRNFLHAAASAGIAAYASSLVPSMAAAEPTPAKKLNVLMILVDDLRPQLKCFGKPFMVSPNLDRFASEASIFERHYCPQSLCAPARISLLSGCRPDTTGIYDLDTTLVSKHPEIQTLPQFFKQQGYTTVSYGKVYHHLNDDPTGWSRPPREFTAQSKGRGYVQKENIDLITAQNSTLGPPFERTDVPDNAYPDGELADEAIKLLGELKSQTFFAALGFHRPHLPFCAPAKYWGLYPADSIELPKNRQLPKDIPAIAADSWGELRQYHGVPRKGPLEDGFARKLIHGYYASVSYLDAQIGRVLAELDRLGLRDNTIVVVTADHGWLLDEHGLWCKHSNFEEATRVPLMIRTPTGVAGQRIGALTEHTDVYPTLCELAGRKVPAHVEGTSLLPLLNNPTRPWKSAAFSQYPRGQTMGYTMRTDRYRFTRWGAGPNAPLELYDYQTDPGGDFNLAQAPDKQALVEALDQQLTAGWKGNSGKPG